MTYKELKQKVASADFGYPYIEKDHGAYERGRLSVADAHEALKAMEKINPEKARKAWNSATQYEKRCLRCGFWSGQKEFCSGHQ